MLVKFGVFVVSYYLLSWLLSSLVAPFIWLASSVAFAAVAWQVAHQLTTRLLNKHLPPVQAEGKAILITGCDTGFGHTLAIRLNERGFHVFAGVLTTGSGNAKTLVSKSQSKNRLTLVKLDVTSNEDVLAARDLVKKTLAEKSLELYAIVNNAGVWYNSPIEWHKEGPNVDDFERVINVNLFGHVRMIRTFASLIRASKGRIVDVNSYLGRMIMPQMATYAASKHAAIAVTEVLALEMQQFGVKVISIEPWGYSTGLLDQAAELSRKGWDNASEEVREAYGESSLDSVLRINESFGSAVMVDQRTLDVVEQIEHALTVYEPNFVYSVMILPRRVAHWILFEFLPHEWRFALSYLGCKALGKYWPRNE